MVSASVGISLLPDNAREASALVSQANMAMQHAKHLGGNTFQFFTDNLQACTLVRLQLENQLRKAIDEGQLEVFYQPKIVPSHRQPERRRGAGVTRSWGWCRPATLSAWPKKPG